MSTKLKFPVYFYPQRLRELLPFLLKGKKHIRVEPAVFRHGDKRVKEVLRFKPTGQGDSPALMVFWDGTFSLILNAESAENLRLFSSGGDIVQEFIRLGLVDRDALDEAAGRLYNEAQTEERKFLHPCRCGGKALLVNVANRTSAECTSAKCGAKVYIETQTATDEDLELRLKEVLRRWNAGEGYIGKPKER